MLNVDESRNFTEKKKNKFTNYFGFILINNSFHIPTYLLSLYVLSTTFLSVMFFHPNFLLKWNSKNQYNKHCLKMKMCCYCEEKYGKQNLKNS